MMLSRLLVCSFALVSVSLAQEVADPADITISEFAREPMVRNVVAVTVDEQGRVYATSVVRRQAADLDIRRFSDEWLAKELSLTTVAEKRAFFESELTPENSDLYADRFEDTNGDGSFDFADLDLLADQITVLTDTDGNGAADTFKKFNATQNSKITGIAAGLAAWDGALYATVEPDLLRLGDLDADGVPTTREVLAHGFSVHVGYGGHNFSGAIIGPDGRLYASVADRGMNVTDRDGNAWPNPHSGAIVRSELDGSNFEIYATGLRNVQEPAFDAWGNLLGVDNDGDFAGEEERFVYITEGSDTGWRTNWQYRGDDYLPWMDEGLAIPAHAGQPAYITPTLQNYKDGPAGFAFNPGTALTPGYRDYFFMTAFPSRNLYAFQAEPDGAAFRMVNEHTVLNGVLMVGLGFAPDGSLFVTDWSSSGYAMNEKGAVWRIDAPSTAGSDLRRETARLIAADWSAMPAADLRQHLGHLDQRVRMKAQFELVRRDATDVLLEVATDESAPRLARGHAIWGVGQLLRRGTSVSSDSLRRILQDSDAELRAQTAKVVGEAVAPIPSLLRDLRALLHDEADRPRFFAAIALGRLRDSRAVIELGRYLDRDGHDAYHRHAAIMGLTGCATPAELVGLKDAFAQHVRLGAVVALRRQGAAEVQAFLHDADPLVVSEAASAIHDDESIPAALPALAALLTNPDPAILERTTRRALSAAQRLRGAEHAAAVAAFADDSDQPRDLRLLALTLLRDWPDPAVLDSVEGRYRPLEPMTPSSIVAGVEESLVRLGKSSDFALARLAWEAAAVYDIRPSSDALVEIVRNDTPIAGEALTQLDLVAPEAALGVAHDALQSKHETVRQTALRLIARETPATFVDIAKTVLASGAVADAQLCIALLAQSTEDDAGALLLNLAERLHAGTLDATLALDVIEATAIAPDSAAAQVVAEYTAGKPAADPLSPYLETLQGGNVARGREVFETSVAAQCTLCHRVSGAGSDVGPALAGLGERLPRFILESLVDPGAQVAPRYGMTTVTLTDDTMVSGNLISDTPDQVRLLMADGSEVTLPREQVASRTPEMSAMPPMGTLLPKTELRDLMAYLQTL